MAEDGVLETHPPKGTICFRDSASVLSGSSSKLVEVQGIAALVQRN